MPELGTSGSVGSWRSNPLAYPTADPLTPLRAWSFERVGVLVAVPAFGGV